MSEFPGLPIDWAERIRLGDAARVEIERCNRALLQYENNIRAVRSELAEARDLLSMSEALKELHQEERDAALSAVDIRKRQQKDLLAVMQRMQQSFRRTPSDESKAIVSVLSDLIRLAAEQLAGDGSREAL